MMLCGALQAAPVSPRRLLEVVDLGNPVISPDGRLVAFRSERASVERNTYDTAWYIQTIDGQSPPLRVAYGGIPLREHASGLIKPSPAIWSHDGRHIYYRALINDKVSIWRARTDGSSVRQVTNDAADVRSFRLSPDGRTLLYSVGPTRREVLNAEQVEYDEGVRIDETVFIGAGLLHSSLIGNRAVAQRFEGDWFTTGLLLSGTPDRWRAVDLDSFRLLDRLPSDLAPTLLESSEFPDAVQGARKVVADPGGTGVATLTRIEPGDVRTQTPTDALAVRKTGERQPVTCSDETCTGKAIDDIQWRPGSKEILFTVTDRIRGRAQSIYRWNTATGTVRLVASAEGLLRGSSQRPWDIPCSVGEEVLVCVTAHADSPPRLEAITISNGERRVLFDPNIGLRADISDRTPARLMRWKDARGREFSGYLFDARKPHRAGPPPLFVTFYTCDGFLRGGLGDEWPLASMAEKGISALCINGLPGSRPEVQEHYGQGLLAVESVVELLSASGVIDREKVGMGGLSYGSEVTMWVAMHSDLLAAASFASPSATPTWYLFNSLRDSFIDSAWANWKLGRPDETPQQWREISPAFNLDRIAAPLLFQMSEQEYLVSLDYALPLIKEGRAEMHVFPQEPHVKFHPRHKLAVNERNLDWFRFWLLGDEDPDEEKADQYARWRSMREAEGKPGP